MRKNEANSGKRGKVIEVGKYYPEEFELNWQSKWEEEGVYQPDLESANDFGDTLGKKPFFNLMMFPYPSAEGLHVGSVFSFSAADIYGRFKRMNGYSVFEPIGLDGFGIHSENHAIKTGTHPMDHAERTEKNFYRQLHAIGNGFAWKNKVETYDPEYYRWTQWLFIQLFKAGLAYRKKADVNWCPSCKTVIADEQALVRSKKQEARIEGKVIEEEVEVKVCERCGSEIERRDLEQWFFRITKYAGRLDENIPGLNWSEKVKIAQKNWIGKKSGINIKYEIVTDGVSGMTDRKKEYLEVFTTRPDTNFGATFVALAPDGEITKKILRLIQDQSIKKRVKVYIEKVKMRSEIERVAEGREKTGEFTGLYAINQLTGYRMPIWVSDFVLAGFGTGALVGVPGHDKRDFEFARRFGLDVIRVVVGKDGDRSPISRIEQVQEEEGTMVNSGFLDGKDINEAKELIMKYIESKGYGERVITYRLRDWLISRQRYWGPPIPMIYCEACAKKGRSWFMTDEAEDRGKGMGISNFKFPISNKDWDAAGWYPVKEEDLPVKLPYIKDYKPMGTGKSPLANYSDFYDVDCPECGGKARRETDVSDTFLDSSWYYLRYLASDCSIAPFPSKVFEKNFKSKKQAKGFVNRSDYLPVNMYIGGAEHSVLHLLYARFISMVLYDLSFINFEEPFRRFYAHGLILKDGAKMSKSRGNVINPDEYIKKYGADTLRMYLHFLGPLDEFGDFRDTGIEGMHRFLKRVWTLFKRNQESRIKNQDLAEGSLKMMHGTIKGVTEDLKNLRYNTAIAKLMTWYNFLAKQSSMSREEVATYLKLIAPFAPYVSEELWQKIVIDSDSQVYRSIHLSKWPEYDERYLKEEEAVIAIQINGKMRDTIKYQKSKVKNQKDVEKLARGSERVRKYINGKVIRKVIFVPGKILNFVI